MFLTGIMPLLLLTNSSHAYENLLRACQGSRDSTQESRDNIQNCSIDSESGREHNSAFMEGSSGLGLGSAREHIDLELGLGGHSSWQNTRTYSSKQPEKNYGDRLTLALASPTFEARRRTQVSCQQASQDLLPKWLQGIKDHRIAPPRSPRPEHHFAHSVVSSEMSPSSVTVTPRRDSGQGSNSKSPETPQAAWEMWQTKPKVQSTTAEVSSWSQAHRENMPTASERATQNNMPTRLRGIISHYPHGFTEPRHDFRSSRATPEMRSNIIKEPTVHELGPGHRRMRQDTSVSQGPKMKSNVQAAFPTVPTASQVLWETTPSSSQKGIAQSAPDWLQGVTGHHSHNEILELQREYGPLGTSPETEPAPFTQPKVLPSGQFSGSIKQHFRGPFSQKLELQYSYQTPSVAVLPLSTLGPIPSPLQLKPPFLPQQATPESLLEPFQGGANLHYYDKSSEPPKAPSFSTAPAQAGLTPSTQPMPQECGVGNDSLRRTILKSSSKVPERSNNGGIPLEATSSSSLALGSSYSVAHQQKRKAATQKDTPESTDEWQEMSSNHPSKEARKTLPPFTPIRIKDTVTYRYDKYADGPLLHQHKFATYYPEEQKHWEWNNMDSNSLKVPIIIDNLQHRNEFEHLQHQIYGFTNFEYGAWRQFPNLKSSPSVKYRNIWLEAIEEGLKEIEDLDLKSESTLEPELQVSLEEKEQDFNSTPLHQNFGKTREWLQCSLPAIIHEIRVIGNAFPRISKDITIKKLQYDAWHFYNHFWNHIESIYSDENQKVLWEMNSIMSHKDLVRIIDEFEGSVSEFRSKTSIPKARRILTFWMSVRLKALCEETFLIQSTSVLSRVLNEFYHTCKPRK